MAGRTVFVGGAADCFSGAACAGVACWPQARPPAKRPDPADASNTKMIRSRGAVAVLIPPRSQFESSAMFRREVQAVEDSSERTRAADCPRQGPRVCCAESPKPPCPKRPVQNETDTSLLA